jgi:hypothetical protein
MRVKILVDARLYHFFLPLQSRRCRLICSGILADTGLPNATDATLADRTSQKGTIFDHACKDDLADV